jgi:hypothetical protein
MRDCPQYREQKDIRDFCTDSILHHFLIARKFDVQKSSRMLITALEWRAKRNPNQWFQRSSGSDLLAQHERESATGKIQLRGRDKYQREIIVFDNTVQNTDGSDGQLNFLAWNLEMAIHTMPQSVDKYVIFMHLKNFSIFNSPPAQTTKETLLMLTTCFPERLGHCICYQPPFYFFHVFNLLKSLNLIDKRTLKKVIFINDDVSDGSENDVLLSAILGNNWKALTNASAPVVSAGCSPGFRPAEYWPWLMQRWEQVNHRLFGATGEAHAAHFDMSALDRLSMPVPAEVDKNGTRAGATAGGTGGGGGGGDDDGSGGKSSGSSTQHSQKPLDHTRRHRRHSLTAKSAQYMRKVIVPTMWLLSMAIQMVIDLMEWIDDVGNRPFYGTVTTYVAVGFMGTILIIATIIKVFYKTIEHTLGYTWKSCMAIVDAVLCLFDRTGECQFAFAKEQLTPFVWTLVRMLPYTLPFFSCLRCLSLVHLLLPACIL